jgi:hypothetical protein
MIKRIGFGEWCNNYFQSFFFVLRDIKIIYIFYFLNLFLTLTHQNNKKINFQKTLLLKKGKGRISVEWTGNSSIN